VPHHFLGEDRRAVRQHGDLGLDGPPPGAGVVDPEVRVEPRHPEIARPGEVDPLPLLGAPILVPGDRDGLGPVEGELRLRLPGGPRVELEAFQAPGLPELNLRTLADP
jgi:hypothetical protein